MRTVKFAFTVFALLFIAVISNSLCISRIFGNLENELSAIETDDMKNFAGEITVLYEKYKSHSLYISLSVNHDDLSEIEASFAEIIGAANADSKEDVITLKSRLCDRLGHIRRLAGINIDSIF